MVDKGHTPTPEQAVAEILDKGQPIMDHGTQRIMFSLSALKWNLIGVVTTQREALPDGYKWSKDHTCPHCPTCEWPHD